MNLDEWIDELDFRVNSSVIDNIEWVKIHIDDLIGLTECIKEYFSIDKND